MNARTCSRFAVTRRMTMLAIGTGVAVVASSTAPAYASSAAQHGPATLLNPVVSGPGPSVPANCPFSSDDLTLNFVDGNAVFYGTENANGDWGGANAEGSAVFSSHGTPLYQGHLSVWFGGGNNAGSQTEFGFTMDFHGTGAGGSLTIHASQHQTTNNSGTPTADASNINITCS